MDIRATFLPVAEELIDSVFPTAVTYVRKTPPTYDPATGDVVENAVSLDIKAGVLSRGRIEGGGVAERYELRLWVHHGTSGLTALPTTADEVVYDSTIWKVTDVDPTYSSEGLIASRITARNQ